MGAPARDSLKGSIRLGGYLRKLRAGYGYSLRRVEERARDKGGEIDNSQLSRYEKGICFPSFDKLRILADVFNVSIQSFSDVVDLEAFEELKPETGSPAELIDRGYAALKDGDNGMAFALAERCEELLLDAKDGKELIARSGVLKASSLTKLGKLALAEQTLRNVLRLEDDLNATTRAQVVLLLASIHADLGDLFLSEMEAKWALEFAQEAGEENGTCARALHALGRALEERGRHAEAVQRYREAAESYTKRGETYEPTKVRANIGTCYVAMGKLREGVRMLKATIQEARAGGFRRLEAQGWANLGEAYFRQDDLRRARGCFRESDALAVYNDEKQADILFFNAFYEWKMAEKEGNPTREKIAFGRMKALRSSVERRLPEVDEFDAFIERGRAHA